MQATTCLRDYIIMKLFYRPTAYQLLKAKNEIFVTRGVPALEKNGFEKAPFPESLYGKNNLGDYTYEFCRLNMGSNLEMITVHITKGDRWIQIFLNIFKLEPQLDSLSKLTAINGIQFRLNPNNRSKMRLRSDDFKGMPLFNTKEHQLKSFYTEKGFWKSVNDLGKLVESDMENINSSVTRWHELHKPMVTTWEGHGLI